MTMGSVGLSAGGTPIPSDLEAIYQGGDFFLDRMKVLGDRMVAADKSLAALALGQDIVAVKKDADAQLVAANATVADAAKTLSDAKAQAAKIIADAQSRAQSIVDSASSDAAATMAKADAAKKKSDTQIAASNAQAAAALADATDKQSALTSLTDAAQQAIADAKAAHARADKAAQAAMDTQKLYQDKVAKIQAAIG